MDLGKLIFGNREEKALSWFRMAHLLLKGIREHAVEGDTEEYERFQSDMKALEDRFNRAASAQEVLVLAGSAVKQMEDYNRGATKFLSAKAEQVQHMVGMLTRTIGDTATLDRDSFARLKRIERRLEKASAIEDVLAVKAHMAECLETLREESNLRAAQIQKLASSIDEPCHGSPETARGDADCQADDLANLPDDSPALPLDSLTGLPRRAAALQCLTDAVRVGRPQFVAVLHVRQLAAVNNRYGVEVGDSLLLSVCSRLRPILGLTDELFRWSGNCFLAVLERPGELSHVIWEVNRVIPKNTQESFFFKSRSLSLNLGVESAAFRVAEFSQPKALEAAIDRFLGVYAEV